MGEGVFGPEPPAAAPCYLVRNGGAVVFSASSSWIAFWPLQSLWLTHPEGGRGISWIFQMGMGYTFYLPFAFYVAGLLCWSYTVIRLVTMGRVAGYGLALMFIAGYALLFPV